MARFAMALLLASLLAGSRLVAVANTAPQSSLGVANTVVRVPQQRQWLAPAGWGAPAATLGRCGATTKRTELACVAPPATAPCFPPRAHALAVHA